MEIVKIGEVYSESIRDLSRLHNFLFINTEIHAKGDALLLSLKPKYERLFKKGFQDFNVLELEEFKQEFVSKMENIYDEYKDKIKII